MDIANAAKTTFVTNWDAFAYKKMSLSWRMSELPTSALSTTFLDAKSEETSKCT